MPRLRSNEAQVTRCIALLVAMLQARRGVSLRQLYERNNWNLRAAYRDLNTLRSADIPVEQHEHGWYRLPEAWIPPAAIGVTRDELRALDAARRLAPGLSEAVFGRALDRLWSRLVSPSRQQALPLGWEALFQCPPSAAIDLAPHRAVIETAQEALRARRVLRICYRKVHGDDREHQRVIEPSFLYWCPRVETLYLRAYCRERAEFRLFAVQRILAAVVLDEPYARRPDPAWDTTRAFGLWHRTTTEQVSIRFSPAVAREIGERRWHATQRLTPTADGGVVLEMDVAAPEEMERWLLGFAADAEVLAPTALAERLRRRHAEAAGLRAGVLPARCARPPRAAAATQAEGTVGPLAARRRAARR